MTPSGYPEHDATHVHEVDVQPRGTAIATSMTLTSDVMCGIGTFVVLSSSMSRRAAMDADSNRSLVSDRTLGAAASDDDDEDINEYEDDDYVDELELAHGARCIRCGSRFHDVSFCPSAGIEPSHGTGCTQCGSMFHDASVCPLLSTEQQQQQGEDSQQQVDDSQQQVEVLPDGTVHWAQARCASPSHWRVEVLPDGTVHWAQARCAPPFH